MKGLLLHERAMRVRLGILMMGEGVGALCVLGVMRALEEHGLSPYCVCGMSMGAYPAALWSAGMDTKQAEEAALHAATLGKKLLDKDWKAYAGLRTSGLIRGKKIARLLSDQTQALSVRDCVKQVSFLCMAIPSRRSVLFSPHREEENTVGIWTHHAPIWFAARAALSEPPFIRPANFVGVPLCASEDVKAGIGALYAMGATHVLCVSGVYTRSIPQNIYDFAAWERNERIFSRVHGVRKLDVLLGEKISPLGFGAARQCVQAGFFTAHHAKWDDWGEGAGKVVPFR